MNKKMIFLPLLAILISGCTSPSLSEDNPSSIVTSEPIISSEDSTSSEEVTSTITTSQEDSQTSEDSQPPTSEDHVYQDISEIKALAASLATDVNESNIAISDYRVQVRAQLLLIQDYVAGGNDYSYRHKALIANETGYMLAALDGTSYDLIKPYVDQQQVYDFQGYIGLYNGHAEIVVDARPTYLEGVSLDYQLPSLAKPSISQVFEDHIIEEPLNNKGIGYDISIQTMTLKYVMKLENSLALFSDGTNVIQVYGHAKFTNGFSLGSVYEITYIPGQYIYKPTLNYIAHKLSDVQIDDINEGESISASELYDASYIKEPKFASDYLHNQQYAALFIEVYEFQGFVSYYIKGDDYNIVFEDQASNGYNTYMNAASAEALFINNESGLGLYTNRDFENCMFWEQASLDREEKSAVDFMFVPYLYNTNHYFQIHVFETTYTANL